MLTMFNVFFKSISTKWNYRVVVCDFVFSVLSGAAHPDSSWKWQKSGRTDAETGGSGETIVERMTLLFRHRI